MSTAEFASANDTRPVRKAPSSSFLSPTLLAASKHGRCTCLVYSCYASSWSFGSGNGNGRDVEIASNGTLRAVKSGGLVQGATSYPGACFQSRSGRRIERRSSGTSSQNDPDSVGRSFKSNLKKQPSLTDQAQQGADVRKVSWPDAHGQDIARVHEFEPSVSDDGELRGVKNSCVCTIQ